MGTFFAVTSHHEIMPPLWIRDLHTSSNEPPIDDVVRHLLATASSRLPEPLNTSVVKGINNAIRVIKRPCCINRI